MTSLNFSRTNTVEPLYYGHQEDINKCPYYRGVRFREVGFVTNVSHDFEDRVSIIQSLLCVIAIKFIVSENLVFIESIL